MNKMTSKTILFVHYGANWIRGSEVVLINLIKGAKEKGFIPLLWCNSNILADKVRTENVEVIVNNFVCLGYWVKPRWNIIQFVKQIILGFKLIKQKNVSVVHCNNGAPCQWMGLLCRLLNIPMVLHLHARYQFRDRMTLLFSLADYIVGVSKSVVKVFKKGEFDSNRLKVIYNGVNTKVTNSKAPLDIRQKINASSKDFILLYIGSLIKRKGLIALILSIAEINKELDVKLVIYGGGEELTNLQELIARLSLDKNVYIFPETDNVAALYTSNVDCFISAPKEEVFGLTLAEASLAGLPIISTNVPGVNEIYKNEFHGLLVPADDSVKLANAIKSYQQNPELAKEYANNAKRHIKDRFTLFKQSQSFSELYNEVIALKKLKIDSSLLILLLRHLKLTMKQYLLKLLTALQRRSA